MAKLLLVLIIGSGVYVLFMLMKYIVDDEED